MYCYCQTCGERICGRHRCPPIFKIADKGSPYGKIYEIRGWNKGEAQENLREWLEMNDEK
jgi:hypothetical protein